MKRWIRAPALMLALTALVALATLTVGCSAAPERSIVDEFFAAARLRDLTALSRLATVTYEPLERGIVIDFTVTKVAPDQTGSKDVTVRAVVRLADGRQVEKNLRLTLRRAALTAQTDDARRWIVTAVNEV